MLFNWDLDDFDKYNRRRSDDMSAVAAEGALKIIVISFIVSLRRCDIHSIEKLKEALIEKSVLVVLRVEDDRLRRTLWVF